MTVFDWSTYFVVEAIFRNLYNFWENVGLLWEMPAAGVLSVNFIHQVILNLVNFIDEIRGLLF